MRSRAEPLTFRGDQGVYGVPGDLSPWDLRFDPTNRAHLDGEPDGRARFRVWAEPELADGLLVLRAGRVVEGHPMEPVASAGRFVFWEAVVGPFPEGAEFSFAFRAPSGRGVYLAPSGVTNAIERIDRWPLTLPPAMTVPDWSRGMLIYQVFPDRFAVGASQSAGTEPWGAPPSPRGFQGGDLAGVEARLDYLADLGVQAVYLNPIFTSPSNHRYDAVDYYNVDPMLGGNAALASLIEEAHARSMKIILDASFNHVHPRFFAFADVMRHGPASEYWEWFRVSEWPLKIRYRAQHTPEWRRRIEWLTVWSAELGIPTLAADDEGPSVEPSYETWYGVPTMPRVDLSNSAARAYMLEVAAYWPREYGIDGWRMDVVRYVDPDFWGDFRETVRAANPGAYLLCEVMGDASPWLQGDRFDATMNYTFRDLCVRFFATEEIDGATFLDDAARLWAQYAWPITLANQNLLGSHDTPRFMTECGGETWRLRLAAVFQMTFPGAPSIYYGDELGLEGADDPESRGAFPWQVDPAIHAVHRTYHELSRLRADEPALVTGEWRPLRGQEGLVGFSRALGDRRLLVVINRDDVPTRVDVPFGSKVIWGDGGLSGGVLEVAPRSAVVVV